MANYAIVTDLNRCTGCLACTVACKAINGVDVGSFWIKTLRVGPHPIEGGSGTFPDVEMYFLPVQCQHCENPECVKVCPTGAMHKDAETGLVSVDADKCVGCGYCHMACPYNAPKVDRSKGHSVKCDGCAERVAAGEKPVCVEACPARALDFGTVEEMSKVGERGNIAPLPEPHYTNPNLFIKPSADAKPAGSADGKVVNPLEVM